MSETNYEKPLTDSVPYVGEVRKRHRKRDDSIFEDEKTRLYLIDSEREEILKEYKEDSKSRILFVVPIANSRLRDFPDDELYPLPEDRIIIRNATGALTISIQNIIKTKGRRTSIAVVYFV